MRDHDYATEVGKAIAQISDAQPSCVATDRPRKDLTHIDGFESFLKDLAEHRAPRSVDIVLSGRPR